MAVGRRPAAGSARPASTSASTSAPPDHRSPTTATVPTTVPTPGPAMDGKRTNFRPAHTLRACTDTGGYPGVSRVTR